MTVSSTSTISSLQGLTASAGDAFIVEGYFASGDGGGGEFYFEGTAPTSATISGATASSVNITAASNASPIVITSSAAHGFAVGQTVLVVGVVGNTAANGTWTVGSTSFTSTTFSLVYTASTTAIMANSVGNGAYSSGGTASSVVVTTSAAHGMKSGQQAMIGNVTWAGGGGINGTWPNTGALTTTTFSIGANPAGTWTSGGSVGDGGRSIPSSVATGRFLRVDRTLNAKYYGAKCDGATNDRAAIQGMLCANPGGHYVLPGSDSNPVAIYMGRAPLFMMGTAWIFEGGGATALAGNGGGAGGTTLKWDAGTSGLVALNNQGAGTIRGLTLLGGDNFVGAQGGTWPDAIIPNFNDQIGTNPFTWRLASMSRQSNVVTVTVGTGLIGGTAFHTYSPGTQITISGVSEDSGSMNGLYYITSIGPAGGPYNTFTYACSGVNVPLFTPLHASYSSISNTGTSTADGIVAGTCYLNLENINVQSWGRFGINAASDSVTYWADDQTFRNVTVFNCRGIGIYIHGNDSQASDFYQVNVQSTLVGGILDGGFLGNTYVAPNVSNCGADESSVGGTTVPASVSCTSNVVTVTTTGAHGLLQGQAAVLAGLSDPTFQAPSGSAVFVASVISTTQFTYNMTHANGTASSGTVRLATGSELFTAAGVGQTTNGSMGTGFSYWINGNANNRVIINPYAEGTNGSTMFGTASIVLGGALGAPISSGFDFPHITVNAGTWNTNIGSFDGNLHGLAPDKGTTLSLQGGHFSEWANQINFQGHVGYGSRWYLRDEPQSANPYMMLARNTYYGVPRLTLFKGPDVVANVTSVVRAGGVVTVTTSSPHGIGSSSFVVLGPPAASFTPSDLNGTFQVLGVTSTTFQYSQGGANETASVLGTITTTLANYTVGESRLSAEGAGGVALNYDGGTGGVRFCDGAGNDAVAWNSAGQVTRYGKIATVAGGMPAEYAQAAALLQSASIASTTLYAVPPTGAGIYRISYYAKVTTAASTSSSVTLTIGWTDEDDSVALSVTVPTPSNSTGNAGVAEGTIIVDAKASTNVTYATTYASTGGTSMKYKLKLRLEAL